MLHPGFMTTGLLASVLLLAAALESEGALILPRQMDWYNSLAKDVVLCEEQAIEIKKIAHHRPESSSDWIEIRTEVTCKVVRAFKGALQPGEIVHVDYDMIFYRRFRVGYGYTQLDSAGKVVRVVPPQYLPAGRALLFLTRKLEKPTYDVVTAKLIQQGKVYQYLQAMDPGPLELFPQRPENFESATGKKDEPESEDELIKDELIAVKKAGGIGGVAR
jgi:hypothetical protein